MYLVIPDFVRRVALLVDVLESAFKKSGKGTKKSIASISVHKLSWGAIHDEDFLDLQKSLRHAVNLSYPNRGRVLCVYTDASSLYWSGVVTQATADRLRLPLEQKSKNHWHFLEEHLKGQK